MENPEWYARPLDAEDILAGGLLLLIGGLSIALYIIVLRIMKRQDKASIIIVGATPKELEFKEIVGYRFLISAGIADILLLFNYAIWPGLTILFKSEIINKQMRHWMQLYLDWAWFSMVWHYTLVGWSRWSAIANPHRFRNQRRGISYAFCAGCYVIASIQVLATHFQSWYVTFYYEPSTYGMLAENFKLYLTGGQSAMFLAYHTSAIIPPMIFYTLTVILLCKRNKTGVKHSFSTHHSRVESRLLLPCVSNLVIFIIGQVVITFGTGESKWAGWTVMLVFCANSAVNPILLLACSVTIRRQVFALLVTRRMSFEKMEHSTVFKNVRCELPSAHFFEASSCGDVGCEQMV